MTRTRCLNSWGWSLTVRPKWVKPSSQSLVGGAKRVEPCSQGLVGGAWQLDSSCSALLSLVFRQHILLTPTPCVNTLHIIPLSLRPSVCVYVCSGVRPAGGSTAPETTSTSTCLCPLCCERRLCWPKTRCSSPAASRMTAARSRRW